MTARERVSAAIRGDFLDRPPVSFWGHFYHRESSAQELVQATLEFQRAYDWDWIKLNPRRQYHAEPWGVRWRYSGRPNEKPVKDTPAVRGPDDWKRITERAPDEGALGEQIEAVRLLKRGLDPEVPFIETVFSPLAVLAEMVDRPATLKQHMGSHPEAVRGALAAVTATFEGFVRKILEAGADGIFFATVDWASRDLMTPEEYRDWARATDLRILAAASGAWLNVLHVCKSRNLLFDLADYPVSAFSWAATDPTNPSLRDALPRLHGAVMGGISQDDALQGSDVTRTVNEVREGFEQTGGRRWLVAPGCSIPPATPAANLKAARAAVESIRLEPEART